VRRLVARAVAQGVALLDAEAVLLVDDDQAELGEAHAVLDERVRADDDARLAGLRVEQRLPLRLRAHRAGEQGDAGGVRVPAQLPGLRQRPEQGAQRPGVLRGEHLGGREHRGLPAGVDRLQHRPQRDQRLARADVALHQAVHRVAPRQVGRHLLADLALALGERVRQLRVERVEQATPAGRARGRRAGDDGGPAQGQRQLHAHRLVPDEPVARRVDVGVGLGHVDAAHGQPEVGEALAAAEVLGQRVGDVDPAAGVEHVEHLPHAARDHLRGDLPGGRVDRQERAEIVVALQRLELRVGQLELVPERPDLAGEQRPGARCDQALEPVPVEERAVEPAAPVVADHHGQQLAAALPHRAQRGLLDLGDERGVLAQLQPGDVGELAAVDVAARVVPHQVAHRGDLQLGGQQLGRLHADHARQGRGHVDPGLDPGADPGHSTPSTRGKSRCPPQCTTTSTSGWVRRRSAANPSPSASSAPSPSSAVTISPPAVSMR
jgi:hypothetical protein